MRLNYVPPGWRCLRRRWPIKPARISLPFLPLAEVVVIALCYDSESGGGGGNPYLDYLCCQQFLNAVFSAQRIARGSYRSKGGRPTNPEQ